MIIGFEEETQPLTTEEMTLVSRFAKGLQDRIGEEKAVTSDRIIRTLKGEGYPGINGPRVRKIINYIRTKKLLKNLVATSKGYYIEPDPEKVRLYVAGLKARAEAILAVANSYT